MENSNIQLNLSKNQTHNIYDEVPYESYSYPMSHPYHLMTMATLFGMKPTLPDKSRILELGCASGGNLIPHAVNYPTAQFIGVDLSKVEIAEANKSIAQLNLKNIKFYNNSIMAIDDTFGKFDYIICHGVISWVPEEVRTKIFEICKNNLNENGIAYISYNTLPGWNMVRTIRDMMLYHAGMFANANEKITQSRMMLDFVNSSLENSNSPYAGFLKAEAALLSKQSDYYLFHDHLEADNKQYYFHEFVKEANKHQLQYLADCSISSMYIGNMPPKVIEKLQEVKDIIKTEQYMDFITNRRFRTTLLCHGNGAVQINRNINNEDLTKYNMNLNVVPEKPLKEVDLNDTSESLNFFYNNNKDAKFSTSSSVMKALLYTFYENLNMNLSFNDIAIEANKKLRTELKKVKEEFLNNAMILFLQGYLTITLQKTRSKVNINKPKIARYAAYQLANTNKMWVTNLLHEVIGINSIEKICFSYMNGQNDKKKLLELLMQHAKKGEITLNKQNGEKLENLDEIRKELTGLVDLVINKAVVSALLV